MRQLVIVLSLVAFTSPTLADTTAQTLPFSQGWSNVGLITANDDWSGVPGVIGYRGDGLATTGVNPQTVVAESTTVDVNANQTNPSTFTTGGVTEFQIANPTIAIAGSSTADAPYVQITLDTTGVSLVRMRYKLRDIDGSTDNSIQPVALQYRIGTTGDFTDVPAGFVADASEGPSLATLETAVDVVLPDAVGNQAIVQLRIITTDAVGSDESIGIDDISIVDASTKPTATGVADPTSARRGEPVTVFATVTPGTFPPSTGIAVMCDLSSIGGSATQALADDGANGDVTAGDNTFTFATTVALTSTAGVKSFACTVADSQSRSSSFAISFTVAAVCGDSIVEGVETCDDGSATSGDGCSATCTVETGYSCTGAPSVCTDIDECSLNTDDCDANATCTNTVGAFTCQCNAGYMGNGTTCTDIDECSDNTDDCDANATCTNTPGAFTCACKTGFTGNGTTCTDVDECTAGTDNCDANATCTNTPGTFTCACVAGYAGNGTTCMPNCGDGTLVAPEACDDGDMLSGDGCSMNCTVETGYTCTGTPSSCTATCGDGIMIGAEACDDGNAADADGCDSQCTIEAGYTCTGTPSVCEAPDEGGCCSSSTNPGGVGLLVLFVMIRLRRRRRPQVQR